MNTYKVILVGEGGIGKSTLIKRHKTGEFKSKYVATVGTEVHPLKFHTNKGPVCFNMWDCASQEKFGGLRDGYYIQADAAIVMFSLDSRKSYSAVSTWIRDIKRVCNDIPIIVLGNKCDILDQKITDEDKRIIVDYGYTYYDYSAKSNYNFEKPFLSLARKLGSDESLLFTESAPIEVPVATVSIASNRARRAKVLLQEAIELLNSINVEEDNE